MELRRRYVLTVLIFFCTVLLCGLQHVLLYSVFVCTSQFFCGTLTLLWGMSIQRRVTDRRLRRLLWALVLSMLLFPLAQLAKYLLFRGLPTPSRYAWYFYYVPMVLVASCLLFLSVCVRRREKLPRRVLLPVCLLTCGLILTVLTNDVHRLFFRFYHSPAQIERGDYGYGPAYYVYLAYFVALMLISYITMLRKARTGVSRFAPLLPVLPSLLLPAILLNALGYTPRLWGIPLWTVGDIFCMSMLGFLESCIQIDLIPANTGYARLFSRLPLPVAILDRAGRVVYASAGSGEPPAAPEDRQLCCKQIHGGSVEWTVDLSELHAMNRALAESARQLGQRNDYLKREGRMTKERTELETRNSLYDRVFRLIRPQGEEIEALSALPGEAFLERLPRIAVLTAYVKRRSNMELLAEKGLLPGEELHSALEESLETLRLHGVQTGLNASLSGPFDAARICAAYEQFHRVVMACLPTLSALLVTVRGADALELRLLLRGPKTLPPLDPLPAVSTGPSPTRSICAEGEDFSLCFRFEGEVTAS